MSTFTPGPWRALAAHDESGDVGITADTLSTVLAECFADIRRPGENAHQEAAANGHLVAAGPDMYEALRTLVCRIDKWFPTDEQPPRFRKAEIDRARAALAKADGKQ